MLRVKILCTIGPSSRDNDILTQLIRSGMNVARLNLSHGTHEYHAGTIQRVRTIAAELDKPVAILADLQGPKLRVGKMQPGGVLLEKDAQLILTNDDIVGVVGRIPIQYKALPTTVQSGDRILMDDGLLEVEVLETSDTEIHTRVIIGGTLHDNKGMNLPSASFNIPALTDKDREDVQFALEQQADWIALSFVRTASEVLELKQLIANNPAAKYPIPVISKIEKPEAIRNIDAIIDASDAIMIARGDLGIETSAEAVPMTQKMIIAKCHSAVKPVITATQMLDSMIRNPRPTRAEASDVANAVLDGSDAIRLSGETASGSYPVEAVQTMARIAQEAERASQEAPVPIQYEKPNKKSIAAAICQAAVQTAREVDAKAIVVPTVSGGTAGLLAGFRPDVPIVAVTPDATAQHKLALSWGTYPLFTPGYFETTDDILTDAVTIAQEKGYVQRGDTIVLTAGITGYVKNSTNLMMVRNVERVLDKSSGMSGD